jgi:protoporphyrin/coproporphyrin ferrochelatase
MARLAVVLCNLGGPDGPAAVRPFLFNLFNDPAIIRLPGPLRWLLAKLISRRRAPLARGNYDLMGGKSPLLELTLAQAAALQEALSEPQQARVFVAMRYWHPFSRETARRVKDWEADEAIVLPLYPQYSTTTSASSFRAWREAAQAEGLNIATSEVCCYPTLPGLVQAHAALIRPVLAAAATAGRPRLLFSAHGLPQKIVDAGDPYQWQVQETAAAVAGSLIGEWPELDWRICYQSRVGPLKWIGPATEEEIVRAGAEARPLVVVPIAFVSDHVETLVELDIEYRHLAERAGVPAYHRVPALNTHPAYIEGLASLVRRALVLRERPILSEAGGRICPAGHIGCAQAISG